MTTVQLLETILYDPKEGVFLLDYHCDRMIASAKELAVFFSNNQEAFLQDLIPTRSEISNKLDAAIRNAGKDTRQRLRVLLDFDGAISIQSSHLRSETKSFKRNGRDQLPKEKVVSAFSCLPVSTTHPAAKARTNPSRAYLLVLVITLLWTLVGTERAENGASESNAVWSDSSILVVLDKQATHSDNMFLKHKTTEREVYNEARTRLGLGPVGAPMGDNVPFDVIMYNEQDEVMEATIANIAIEVENPESGALEWITPPLSSGLLNGTMRRKLLEAGELKERVITVSELKKAAAEGRRIKCFNSVRKEYPVTLKC